MRPTIERNAFTAVVLTLAAMLATLVGLYLYFQQHPNFMRATPDVQKAAPAIMLWLIAIVLASIIFTTTSLTTTITEEEDRYMQTKDKTKHIVLPKPRNERFEQYIIERIIDNDERMPDEKGTKLFIKLTKETIIAIFFYLPLAVAIIAPALIGGNPIFTDKLFIIGTSISATTVVTFIIIGSAYYLSRLRNEYRVLRLIKEAEKLRGNTRRNTATKETK